MGTLDHLLSLSPEDRKKEVNRISYCSVSAHDFSIQSVFGSFSEGAFFISDGSQ